MQVAEMMASLDEGSWPSPSPLRRKAQAGRAERQHCPGPPLKSCPATMGEITRGFFPSPPEASIGALLWKTLRKARAGPPDPRGPPGLLFPDLPLATDNLRIFPGTSAPSWNTSHQTNREGAVHWVCQDAPTWSAPAHPHFGALLETQSTQAIFYIPLFTSAPWGTALQA